jgi:hypothetical protein
MLGSLLGPVIGGLLGGFGSQGSGGSQTSTQQVPPELQPLLGAVGSRGMEMGNLPFSPLPFNPVAGFNPYQFAGFDMTANRAMAPNALLQNAESNLADTLGGKFLDGNPYVDNMVTQNMDEWQGRLGSQGLGSGSFGNANLTQSVTQGAQNAANALRYQNYDAERGRQMQGLGMAPSIYGMGYMPAQQMLGIGGTMQQQGQNQLNAAQNEFMRSVQWPFQTWEAMLAPFGRNMGGTTTQSQSGGNVASGLLGGALAGGQLWNMFGGGGGSSNSYGSWRNPFAGYGGEG